MRISGRYIAALCLISLTFTGHGSVAGSPGLGGVIPPDSSSRAYNPALSRIDQPWGPLHGPQIPIGLLPVLFGPGSLSLLAFNQSGFLDSADLLILAVRLSVPDILILNPPASPSFLSAYISAGSISITDIDGNPIPAVSVPPSGLATADGRLIVSSLSPGFGYRIGPVELRTEFYAGSTGSYVTAGPTEDSEGFRAKAESSLDAGIEQSAALIAEIPIGTGAFGLLAVRGTVTYQTLYAHLDEEAAVSFTDPGVSLHGSLFYAYPGLGYGLAVRADAGAALVAGPLIIGFAVLDISARYSRHGIVISGPNLAGETAAISGRSLRPVFVANAGIELSSEGLLTVKLLGDFGYARTGFGHAAVLFSSRRWFGGAGIGWDGVARAGLEGGYISERIMIALSTCVIESVFSEPPLVGIGLRVAHER